MQAWVVRCVMALLCLSPVWARGEEIWLRYRFSENVDREIENLWPRDISIVAELPDDWTLPAGITDPVAGTLDMAGEGDENHFRVVFGRNAPDAPERNALYFGREGAWQGPIQGETMEHTFYGLRYGPIRLDLQHGGEPVDYHAFLYFSAADDRLRAWVKSACYYAEMIESEGREVRLALADRNTNGRFDDIGKKVEDGDWLLIDLNGDQYFDLSSLWYKEVFTIGKFLQLAGTFYELTVAPDGAFIVLDEPTEPFGKVSFPHKAFSLLLTSENGLLRVNGGAGEMDVPSGTYRFYRAEITEADADFMKRVRLRSRVFKESPEVCVKQRETTALVFGPPFKASVRVSGRGLKREINFDLLGQGGATYTVSVGPNYRPVPKLEVALGGSRAKPKVYDLATGTTSPFSLSWRAEKGLEGTYVFTPTIDAGPFAVESVATTQTVRALKSSVAAPRHP